MKQIQLMLFEKKIAFSKSDLDNYLHEYIIDDELIEGLSGFGCNHLLIDKYGYTGVCHAFTEYLIKEYKHELLLKFLERPETFLVDTRDAINESCMIDDYATKYFVKVSADLNPIVVFTQGDQLSHSGLICNNGSQNFLFHFLRLSTKENPLDPFGKHGIYFLSAFNPDLNKNYGFGEKHLIGFYESQLRRFRDRVKYVNIDVPPDLLRVLKDIINKKQIMGLISEVNKIKKAISDNDLSILKRVYHEHNRT